MKRFGLLSRENTQSRRHVAVWHGRRRSVVFGITFRLLVINISSSSPAINKLCHLLPAISVTTCGTVVQHCCIGNTWPIAALQHVVKPDSGSESPFLSTPPAFDAPIRRVPIGIVP